MKDWLIKKIQKLEARKAELKKSGLASEDIAAVRSALTEMEQIDSEVADMRAQLAEIEAAESRASGHLDPIAAYGVRGSATPDPDLEQRQAFKDWVLRVDATAGTTDITKVIPTVIMTKVIEGLEKYGQLYPLATKTNLKGGVSYPVSSLKPTATWVSEGSLSDKQKMTVTSSVVFTYNKLQCRVAVTLEADTVSLPAFESLIVAGIQRAMLKGLEASMISGDGTGEFAGILSNTTIAAGRQPTVTAATIVKYDKWAAIVGACPQAYRDGAVLVLNQSDWDLYIQGMVDSVGQPVARTNVGLDGKVSERFMGLPVVLMSHTLDSFSSADNGDYIGFIFRPEDYVINYNLQMVLKKYFDEDTDEWIHKATLLADGKMIDTDGLVLIKASK